MGDRSSEKVHCKQVIVAAVSWDSGVPGTILKSHLGHSSGKLGYLSIISHGSLCKGCPQPSGLHGLQAEQNPAA